MQSEICGEGQMDRWTHSLDSPSRMELRQKGRGEAEGRVGIHIGSLPRWLRRRFDPGLKESQR